MDVLYNQIESDIDNLSKKIGSFKMDKYIKELREKLKKASESIGEGDYLSRNIMEKADKLSEFVNHLSEVSNRMKSTKEEIPHKIRDSIIKRGAKSNDQGGSYGVYLIISISILALGYIYFRINRIQKKSHVL